MININIKIKYIIDYLLVISSLPGESSYLLQIIRYNTTSEMIYYIYRHICIDIPVIYLRSILKYE